MKLDGDTVVEFQKRLEFQQVTLKVLRWAERDKRLVIKEAQAAALARVKMGAGCMRGAHRPAPLILLIH
jgi:hypothetical protein